MNEARDAEDVQQGHGTKEHTRKHDEHALAPLGKVYRGAFPSPLNLSKIRVQYGAIERWLVSNKADAGGDLSGFHQSPK